ncbi:MAG: hypothetical protein FJ027_05150 [Candidatus Rokubacteria bacterium]|nr:hypothetical protein [Candidatus Rokubacteria bacterium]
MKITFLWVIALLLAGGVAHASNGTSLAVVLDTDAPACVSTTQATATVHAGITSTASAAPASLLASADGGLTFTALGAIETWTHTGRTKTAEEAIEVTVAGSGATVVEVCAIQPGANGNANKKACAAVTITPSCGGDGSGGGPIGGDPLES